MAIANFGPWTGEPGPTGPSGALEDDVWTRRGDNEPEAEPVASDTALSGRSLGEGTRDDWAPVSEAPTRARYEHEESFVTPPRPEDGYWTGTLVDEDVPAGGPELLDALMGRSLGEGTREEGPAEEEYKPPSVTHVLRFFPEAMEELALVCEAGGKKYHGGNVSWDRARSVHDMESLGRHLMQCVSDPLSMNDDSDTYHLAHVAWRALAALQRALDYDE